MILGAIAGFVFGKMSKYIINGIKLDFEGLYPVLVIALMFITFSATDAIWWKWFPRYLHLCSIPRKSGSNSQKNHFKNV